MLILILRTDDEKQKLRPQVSSERQNYSYLEVLNWIATNIEVSQVDKI